MSEPEEEKVVPELPEVPFGGWVFLMLNEDRVWTFESEGLADWEQAAGLKMALNSLEEEPIFIPEDEDED